MEIIKQQEVLGKDFKVYGTFEEPLFLAKDVAEWIEHSNTRMMLKTVDETEKQCVNNPYALKGQQEQWFLTEDGLYEVLMQSRKPIAKEFKREVKGILKEIRITGQYIQNGSRCRICCTPENNQDVVKAVEELRERIDTLLQVMKPFKRTLDQATMKRYQAVIAEVGYTVYAGACMVENAKVLIK